MSRRLAFREMHSPSAKTQFYAGVHGRVGHRPADRLQFRCAEYGAAQQMVTCDDHVRLRHSS
ncbi:MAG TPA: hypothetical protein VGC35_06065 [Allosphingosinicella sp.]